MRKIFLRDILLFTCLLLFVNFIISQLVSSKLYAQYATDFICGCDDEVPATPGDPPAPNPQVSVSPTCIGNKPSFHLNWTAATGADIYSIWRTDGRTITTGDGLMGIYFDTEALTGMKFVKVDPNISKSWPTGSQPVGTDNYYSVQWTGYIKTDNVPSTPYTFYARVEDGVRLYINGSKIIDKWSTGGVQDRTSTAITLAPNTYYKIHMDYYNKNSSTGTAELSWSSGSFAKTVIPQRNFYTNKTASNTSLRVNLLQSGLTSRVYDDNDPSLVTNANYYYNVFASNIWGFSESGWNGPNRTDNCFIPGITSATSSCVQPNSRNAPQINLSWGSLPVTSYKVYRTVVTNPILKGFFTKDTPPGTLTNNLANYYKMGGTAGNNSFIYDSIAGDNGVMMTNLTVRAMEDKCNGDAKMQVNINNSTLLIQTLNSTSWKDYTVPVAFQDNAKNIEIAFTNDLYQSPTCDRNLKIDKTTFNLLSPVTLEGENMPLNPPSAGYVINDLTASGGKYLLFQQNASANGNTTISSNNIVNPSKIGLGRSFDGLTNYISVPGILSTLKNTNLTISIWFKANNTSYAKHILWTGQSIGDGWGAQQEMHISLGSYNKTTVKNNVINFELGDANNYRNGNKGNDLFLEAPFTDTTNYHNVVVTITGGTSGKMYLDGVLVASDTSNLIAKDLWTKVNFGKGGTAARYFNGILDEVGIWSRALNSTEISDLYNTGNGSTYTPPTTPSLIQGQPTPFLSNLQQTFATDSATIYPLIGATNKRNQYYNYYLTSMKTGDESPPSAWSGWLTTPWCDFNPPIAYFDNPPNTCYTPSTWVPNIQIHAADSPPPYLVSGNSISGNFVSGVASVGLVLQDKTGGSSKPFNATKIVNQTWLATISAQPNLTLGNTYNLTVQAKDNNYATSSASIVDASSSTDFLYTNLCLNPWFQIDGGDIHTNKDINAPGGP